MFNGMSNAALQRQIEELRRELKALKDEQIKARRDNEDLMFNLDGDNVPTLQGVIKRVNLVVNGDGTANAELIIEAINGQSKAQIRADRIDLTGAEINLTANNIRITGTNFTVDKDGNMICEGATMNRATMNQANIKSNCVIGSDLSEGVAMQFGKNYADEDLGVASGVHMYMTELEEGGSGYRRGIRFTAASKNGDEEIFGTWVLDARNCGLSSEPDEDNSLQTDPNNETAFIGIFRTNENDSPRAGIRVGEHVLWVDADGVHTSKAIDVVYPLPHEGR